jgi:hypothetical protein
MKRAFSIILIMLAALYSCTELYEADIETDQEVLVVDAYLDNIAGNSYVLLTRSMPFDTLGQPRRVKGARVYLKDNTGLTINYKESYTGYFKPVSASFAGVANKTYTLTVETPAGIFVSEPEMLMPQLVPSLVSGGYNKEEKLVKYYSGEIHKEVNDICEIYYDFKTTGTDIPRFRFTSSQIVEYLIYKELMPPRDAISGYMFYCWFVTDDNSLRFTNEKYRSGSGDIKNQIVSITTPDKKILVPDMDLQTLSYGDTLIDGYEFKRIIRINHFRLNEDSYTYYKGIENQSAAEGKMFDPLPAQLYGNIACKTNPVLPVLGFFEVSSVSTLSWSVSRYGPGYPIVIKKVSNIYPVQQGFTINNAPYFWID